MSPLSAPEPCPNLIQTGTFYFCTFYASRPTACRSHEFHARFCPIGMSKLGIDSPEKVRDRIDAGWRIISPQSFAWENKNRILTTPGESAKVIL